MVAITNFLTSIKSCCQNQMREWTGKHCKLHKYHCHHHHHRPLYFLDMQDPARISGLSPESMMMFLMKRCRYGPLRLRGTWQKPLISSPPLLLFSFASERSFSFNQQLEGGGEGTFLRQTMAQGKESLEQETEQCSGKIPWPGRRKGCASIKHCSSLSKVLDCPLLFTALWTDWFSSVSGR